MQEVSSLDFHAGKPVTIRYVDMEGEPNYIDDEDFMSVDEMIDMLEQKTDDIVNIVYSLTEQDMTAQQQRRALKALEKFEDF